MSVLLLYLQGQTKYGMLREAHTQRIQAHSNNNQQVSVLFSFGIPPKWQIKLQFGKKNMGKKATFRIFITN
jgi:hypothetical protein